MCFRPPDSAIASIVCPECGKSVDSAAGITPTKCPFCKTSFAEILAKAGVVNPTMPSPAASAPAAPKAPGAPKA